jgi:microcystin degradation protein MlrC
VVNGARVPAGIVDGSRVVFAHRDRPHVDDATRMVRVVPFGISRRRQSRAATAICSRRPICLPSETVRFVRTPDCADMSARWERGAAMRVPEVIAVQAAT